MCPDQVSLKEHVMKVSGAGVVTLFMKNIQLTITFCLPIETESCLYLLGRYWKRLQNEKKIKNFVSPGGN